MITHAPKRPVSYKRAMELLDVSRSTLDRKVKDKIFEKFYLGSKPYLDLAQIEKAFIKKSVDDGQG